MTIRKLVKKAMATRADGESVGVTDYLQSGGYHDVRVYVHSADSNRGIVASIEAKSLTEAAAKVDRGEWVPEPERSEEAR